jgi:anti-sigma B factor antagonist
MDGRPSFRVELTVPAEGHAAVALAGELDVHTAPQFKEALLHVIDDGALRVVVDLSEVTFIDSTALGVLIGGVTRLRAAGGSLDIVCPDEKIRHIFEISGLNNVFDIYGGPQKALSGTR